jgi:hypothetical protein
MALVQLAFLILVAGYAIKDAENSDWRWANVGISLASWLVGFILAFVIAYLLHAEEVSIMQALTIATLVGYVGAGGAIAGNKWRSGGIRKGQKVRRTPSDKTVM